MTEMVYGTQAVHGGEAILPRWWRTVDKVTLGCILALFAIGILLGLAASPPLATRNGLPPFFYVQRQAFYGLVTVVAILAASMQPAALLRRLGVVGFLVAFAALALLPAFGTDFGKGAVRWYSLGFISVQPSEFLKPVFLVLVAWLMAAAQEPGGPPGRLLSFLVALAVVALLALQPDFGQAALVLCGWAVMYYVGGASLRLIGAIIALAAGGGVLAYGASEHFARRIDGFLAAEIDPRTQLGYATNAIQEGGLFGVGVGEGEVKWSLPDAHTDFIIAVAAEEYGVVMVLAILALFATIAFRSLMRLRRERDPFIRLAGTGLAAMLAAQAMINTGVAVRMLPAKGMTLPFVSYGGSSLIATGIMVGLLLAFTRLRPQGAIGDALISRRG